VARLGADTNASDLHRFEGAGLQSRHKGQLRNAALAAEGNAMHPLMSSGRPLLILKRLAIWLLETSLEALLLALVLLVLFGYDRHDFAKDCLIYSLSISLMFFATGYLISTVILRASWHGKSSWLYSVIATPLFLIHFEIMNHSMGGSFGEADRYRVVTAGSAIAFSCTLVGTYLLKKWTLGSTSLHNSLSPTNIKQQR
jgi:hypothetical protein